MNQQKPLQAVGQLEANVLGCDVDAVKPVAQALNDLLACHFVLYHQVLKHHWVIKGPQWRELHQQLHDHYDEIQHDGDTIAERIVALGGVPVSHPARQVALSAIQCEDDGIYPVRTMLERDLHAETTLCQRIRLAIQKATAVHDFGTEHLLKAALLHTENRADNLGHLLATDSLQAQMPLQRAA